VRLVFSVLIGLRSACVRSVSCFDHS